jgi:hypothetical protein
VNSTLTGQQKEYEHHNGRVGEVENRRHDAADLQFRCEEMNRVHEEVSGREAARQERPPPPVVVLGAQMEVAQQYGRLAARDYQDDEDEEKEAEHVVRLMGPVSAIPFFTNSGSLSPDAVQYEEQLDEYASERQHAAHKHRRDWLCVQCLFRDLSWYLIRAHRSFQRLKRQLKSN